MHALFLTAIPVLYALSTVVSVVTCCALSTVIRNATRQGR